jgi:hypothetical protein
VIEDAWAVPRLSERASRVGRPTTQQRSKRAQAI